MSSSLLIFKYNLYLFSIKIGGDVMLNPILAGVGMHNAKH